MKCEWKIYTLNQTCTNIYSGGTPSTKQSLFWNGDVNWLSSSETSKHFIYDTKKKITSEGVKFSATKKAQQGSIIVASAGQGYTRGQVSYLMIDTYVSQSVLVLVPKQKIILPLYLYYNLTNRYQELRQLSDGTSTRGGLSGWIMKRMEIRLPSITIQQKIVEILYDIDKRIELNRQINANLEQQAQAIFKEMFIENISKDVKKGILQDIAEITMGQSPDGSTYNKKQVGMRFFQGRAEFGHRFPRERLYTSDPKRVAKKNDILMSVRAPVGNINIAVHDCCIGRGLASIRSKYTYHSFLFYAMLALRQYLDRFNSEGTVFGAINKEALNTLPVDIPSEEKIKNFEQIVSPMDACILNNYKELCYLENIRDTLLPKLMSGEIDVSKIELG